MDLDEQFDRERLWQVPPLTAPELARLVRLKRPREREVWLKYGTGHVRDLVQELAESQRDGVNGQRQESPGPKQIIFGQGDKPKPARTRTPAAPARAPASAIADASASESELAAIDEDGVEVFPMLWPRYR